MSFLNRTLANRQCDYMPGFDWNESRSIVFESRIKMMRDEVNIYGRSNLMTQSLPRGIGFAKFNNDSGNPTDFWDLEYLYPPCLPPVHAMQ